MSNTGSKRKGHSCHLPSARASRQPRHSDSPLLISICHFILPTSAPQHPLGGSFPPCPPKHCLRAGLHLSHLSIVTASNWPLCFALVPPQSAAQWITLNAALLVLHPHPSARFIFTWSDHRRQSSSDPHFSSQASSLSSPQLALYFLKVLKH